VERSQQRALPALSTQTSLSIPDPKGPPPAEANDVSCARVQRELRYITQPSSLATRHTSCHTDIHKQKQNMLEERTRLDDTLVCGLQLLSHEVYIFLMVSVFIAKIFTLKLFRH
jgi:hypothetical protein